MKAIVSKKFYHNENYIRSTKMVKIVFSTSNPMRKNSE